MHPSHYTYSLPKKNKIIHSHIQITNTYISTVYVYVSVYVYMFAYVDTDT